MMSTMRISVRHNGNEEIMVLNDDDLKNYNTRQRAQIVGLEAQRLYLKIHNREDK